MLKTAEISIFYNLMLNVISCFFINQIIINFQTQAFL
jgi:hypothetical protein